MNKKFLNLLSIFLVVMLFSKCGDPEDKKDIETLEVDPTSFSFTEEESRGTFNITSSSAWTMSSNVDWLTFMPASANGSYNGILVRAAANNTPPVRSGILTITTSGGLTETVTVTQGGLEPFIIIDPFSAEVSYNGEDVTVSVTSSYPWTAQIPADVDWITLKPNPTATQAVLAVAKNELFEKREAIVTFKLDSYNESAPLSLEQLSLPLTPPNISAVPDEGEIGKDITFTGVDLNQINEVWFGNLKGDIKSKTDVSITVTIPETATPGSVELKVIYLGSMELIVGNITLKEPEVISFDPDRNLAWYAGTTKSNVPAVTQGNQSGCNTDNGRMAVHAFDGAYDAASTALVDRQYYTCVPTNATRTCWQCSSTTALSNLWVTLNYSATEGYGTVDGSVTFDKIVLIGRENSTTHVQKYKIEISEDNSNWTAVVDPESTSPLTSQTAVITHQLDESVTAKYVRFQITEMGGTSMNTGLTHFALFRTK